ncbi:transglycosylase SLT domain-containing protein, partial [Myxococcota bacterium]|nr:transglycosylase SLT domain-containing protein [Myxococcota bacterium]
HPASPEARRAATRLDELEAKPGSAKRGADDYRQRGDRLFAEMHNEEALAAYDQALAAGLAGSLRATTQTRRAHTLFRLRRYPEALEAFSALPQHGDIPIWRARSLARADRVPEAIQSFEAIARTEGPNQADARSFAASLLEGRQREEEARVHLVWLADDPRQGELSRSALWKLGWSDYRNRRFADAAERFETLVSATTDPIGRLKPVYWRARALAAAGRDDEATPLFASLARDYPLSYYGWRARDRARASLEAPDLPPLARGQIRLGTSALARVRILIGAGLNEYGAAETGRLVRRASGLEDRLALARLLTAAGDFHTAQRIVVDAYELPLARGPIPGREELWQLAWPFAYAELVDAATRAPGSVEPTLVYSIMRETGALLAKRLGREGFHPDDLFDPGTNIALGSSYLGELDQLFPKRLSAAIASYNAGPHVVRTWGPDAKRPDDEWVESIPYAETQSYVKRVLRSVEAYRTIGRPKPTAGAGGGATSQESTPDGKGAGRSPNDLSAASNSNPRD